MSRAKKALRDLADEARRDEPPAGTQDRQWLALEGMLQTQQALPLAAEAAHPLAEAIASSAAQSGIGIVPKVLAGVLVAGAGTYGVVATRSPETPQTASSAAVTEVVEPARSRNAAAAQEATDSDAPPQGDEGTGTTARSEDVKPARRRRSQEPAEPGRDTFLEETALLTRAWGAIRAGNHKQALALADEHRRRFPKGALAEERDASRAVALCHLGRTRAARRAALRFFSKFKDSLHEGRVRKACSGVLEPPASSP